MSTWVKVYNSMPAHPKFLRVGAQGGWLFVCGLCYCNEHLTDGFVSRRAIVALAPGLRRSENVAATLVDAGLWHEVDGGWRIHDYTAHQRNADEIRDRRDRDRQRKAFVRAESPRSPHRSPHGIRDLDVEGRRQKAENNTNVELGSTVSECFAYWQKRCKHPGVMLSDDRRAKIETRLRERQRHHKGDLSAAAVDLRLAIDGAAVAPFVDERGKRHDGIALICRNNDKLEDFMARASSGEVVSLRKETSHLPEWQRPTAEWKAQVAAHLEAQGDTRS